MLNIKRLLLLSLGVIVAGYAISARADYNQDYQTYRSIYETYRQKYTAYITTRNQYLTYGTLTSKNDALIAAREFLRRRDDVLLSYSGLLRGRTAIPEYAASLDDTTNFLNSENNKISAIGSLDDVVSVSREIEDRGLPLQVTARKIVASVNYAKVNGTKINFLDLTNQAETLIGTLRSQGKEVATLERWLLEADNKEILAEQKLSEAQTGINALKARSMDGLSQDADKIQMMLSEANQYLREALNYIKELTDTLKYGNY